MKTHPTFANGPWSAPTWRLSDRLTAISLCSWPAPTLPSLGGCARTRYPKRSTCVCPSLRAVLWRSSVNTSRPRTMPAPMMTWLAGIRQRSSDETTPTCSRPARTCCLEPRWCWRGPGCLTAYRPLLSPLENGLEEWSSAKKGSVVESARCLPVLFGGTLIATLSCFIAWRRSIVRNCGNRHQRSAFLIPLGKGDT